MRIQNFIKHKKNQGFSLVELSVVLFIIALVLGASLSLGSARVSSEKIRQTIERRVIIQDTLQRYLTGGGEIIINGIPCPADGSLVTTSANFGIGTDCAAAVDGRFVVNQGTHNIVIGSVPVRAINLPDDYELDGFNNKFTWVMDSAYQTAAGLTANTTPSTITIKASAAGAPVTGSAAWALISHGSDGYGAWNKGGRRVTKDPTASADEKQNILCGTDIGGAGCQPGGSENTFVVKTPAGAYDDIAVYAMRWQLIPPSKGILTNPDPTCNRPLPGTADLTYNCPTDAKNCVLTPMGTNGQFVNKLEACTDRPEPLCWKTYAPVDENNNANYLYMCVAPDGNYVLCAGTVAANSFANGVGAFNGFLTNPGAPVANDVGSEFYRITPDLTNCIWWQS